MSVREVRLGNKNKDAASSSFLYATISSTPQEHKFRTSSCTRLFATETGKRHFKQGQSITFKVCRFWKVRSPWRSLFHTLFRFFRWDIDNFLNWVVALSSSHLSLPDKKSLLKHHSHIFLRFVDFVTRPFRPPDGKMLSNLLQELTFNFFCLEKESAGSWSYHNALTFSSWLTRKDSKAGNIATCAIEDPLWLIHT